MRAAENARLANERERAAIYESYRARIAAAVAAISRHDVADAASQLAAAPEALRDWEWQHLHARLDDSIAVFPATAGESQFLIRDPKGIRIARLTRSSLRLGDLDGKELWERSFPSETSVLDHPPLLTRHGLRLFSSVREIGAPTVGLTKDAPQTKGMLNVLDEEGRVQTQLRGPAGMDADLVAVAEDGSRLAVVWMRQNQWVFTVYDAESGKPVANSAQDIGSSWALVFSPDGTRLATGGEDGVTRLWDTSTGTMTAQCQAHTRKVFSVAFRPDGLRLATSSADGTVRQWNFATGREVEAPYDRHTGEVLIVKFSSDGESIASAGTDRTVRVWRGQPPGPGCHARPHRRHQRARIRCGRPPAGFSEPVAPRGSVANHDGTVRLWEVGSQGAASVLHGHKLYVYPVAFSPDGQWIASGDWDNKVFLWDALTMEFIASLPHSGNIRSWPLARTARGWSPEQRSTIRSPSGT